RATSNRKSGRDHLGILGEIKSVHPGEMIGIRTPTFISSRPGVSKVNHRPAEPSSKPLPKSCCSRKVSWFSVKNLAERQRKSRTKLGCGPNGAGLRPGSKSTFA